MELTVKNNSDDSRMNLFNDGVNKNSLNYYHNHTGNVIFSIVSKQTPLNPLTIIFGGLIGYSYKINWGDNYEDKGVFDGSILTFTHTYLVNGNYTVTFYMPVKALTYLSIISEPFVSVLPDLTLFSNLMTLIFNGNIAAGTVPDYFNFNFLDTLTFRNNLITGNLPAYVNLPLLKNLTIDTNQISGNSPNPNLLPSIVNYRIGNNLFTGTFPDFTNSFNVEIIRTENNIYTGNISDLSVNTKLITLAVSGCNLSGIFPVLTNCIQLETILASSNLFTTYNSSNIAITCKNFQFQNNLFDDISVNNILNNFVTNINLRPLTGTLNIGGTGNAAPTGQGLIDKASIIAHGWTVTTN